MLLLYWTNRRRCYRNFEQRQNFVISRTVNTVNECTKNEYLQLSPKKVFKLVRPRLLNGHEHLLVHMQVVLGPAISSIALKAKLGWTLNGPTGQWYHQTRVDQESELCHV